MLRPLVWYYIVGYKACQQSWQRVLWTSGHGGLRGPGVGATLIMPWCHSPATLAFAAKNVRLGLTLKLRR